MHPRHTPFDSNKMENAREGNRPKIPKRICMARRLEPFQPADTSASHKEKLQMPMTIDAIAETLVLVADNLKNTGLIAPSFPANDDTARRFASDLTAAIESASRVPAPAA
jgi:hypothetical protein